MCEEQMISDSLRASCVLRRGECHDPTYGPVIAGLCYGPASPCALG
jgi:hypothetical protein